MALLPPTNLSELATELSRTGYRAALPGHLADRWLYPLQRDLKQIEKLLRGDESAQPDMEGPLLLVTRLIVGRMEERGILGPYNFREGRIAQCFQLLAFVIDEEIAARAHGSRLEVDPEVMVTELDGVIDDIVAESIR